MFRVTSLTSMTDKELSRWTRRIALLFVVILIAFVAFYVFDRFRAPQASMVDKQLVALEDAVRADPADTTSRGRLADMYLAKHRFADAITQYTALIDAKSNFELASLGRATAYRFSEQYDLAIADYNNVVAIASAGEMAKVDPNLESAYYGLGLVAIAQSKFTDAIGPLLKATQINRTDADALYALGKAFIGANQAKLAIDPLRTAVALVPVGWPDPYTSLSTAYTALGKTDLASWASAMAAMENGDTAGAQATLTKLVTGEAAGESMVGLGLISELKHDFKTAALWYGKALQLDSTNEPAQMGFKRVGGTLVPGSSPAASPSAGSN